MAQQSLVDLCEDEPLEAFLTDVLVVVDVAVLQHAQVVLQDVVVLTLLTHLRADVVVLTVNGHTVPLVDRVESEAISAQDAVLNIIIETIF